MPDTASSCPKIRFSHSPSAIQRVRHAHPLYPSIHETPHRQPHPIVFLIVAIGAFVFLKLGSEVMEGDQFALDRLILQGLRQGTNLAIPVGPAWLQTTMIDVTSLGGVTILTLLTVIITGYLMALRRISTALFLLLAIAGGALASRLLKSGYARSRPDLVAHLVEVHTTSFPSGHAMNSAITYLALGALLARAEKDWRVRIYIITVAILLTLTIGTSRVYLGVHWPSDVLAGWCVGASWAATCSLLARTLQRNRKIEAPQSATAG